MIEYVDPERGGGWTDNMHVPQSTLSSKMRESMDGSFVRYFRTVIQEGEPAGDDAVCNRCREISEGERKPALRSSMVRATREQKEAIWKIALGVLVERFGGEVTITEEEHADMARRYGGPVIVQAEYVGRELHRSLRANVEEPSKRPVS